MGALRKEVAAKPKFPTRPVAGTEAVSAEELSRRTMKRYPQTMARLGE